MIITLFFFYPGLMIAGFLGFLMRILQLVDSLAPFVGTHYVHFGSQNIFEISRVLFNYISFVASISNSMWMLNDVIQWLRKHQIFHKIFWNRMLELRGFWDTFTAALSLNTEQLDGVLLITTMEILSQPVKII